MPVAMPTFFRVDQDPCSQHHWPAVVPGFQSMPVQLGLLTHAAWQSPRVFAVFTWPLLMFVFGSGVPHTGLQPTCIRTHVHTYTQFQKNDALSQTLALLAFKQPRYLFELLRPYHPPRQLRQRGILVTRQQDEPELRQTCLLSRCPHSLEQPTSISHLRSDHQHWNVQVAFKKLNFTAGFSDTDLWPPRTCDSSLCEWLNVRYKPCNK